MTFSRCPFLNHYYRIFFCPFFLQNTMPSNERRKNQLKNMKQFFCYTFLYVGRAVYEVTDKCSFRNIEVVRNLIDLSTVLLSAFRWLETTVSKLLHPINAHVKLCHES